MKRISQIFLLGIIILALLLGIIPIIHVQAPWQRNYITILNEDRTWQEGVEYWVAFTIDPSWNDPILDIVISNPGYFSENGILAEDFYLYLYSGTKLEYLNGQASLFDILYLTYSDPLVWTATRKINLNEIFTSYGYSKDLIFAFEMILGGSGDYYFDTHVSVRLWYNTKVESITPTGNWKRESITLLDTTSKYSSYGYYYTVFSIKENQLGDMFHRPAIYISVKIISDNPTDYLFQLSLYKCTKSEYLSNKRAYLSAYHESEAGIDDEFFWFKESGDYVIDTIEANFPSSHNFTALVKISLLYFSWVDPTTTDEPTTIETTTTTTIDELSESSTTSETKQTADFVALSFIALALVGIALKRWSKREK